MRGDIQIISGSVSSGSYFLIQPVAPTGSVMVMSIEYTGPVEFYNNYTTSSINMLDSDIAAGVRTNIKIGMTNTDYWIVHNTTTGSIYVVARGIQMNT